MAAGATVGQHLLMRHRIDRPRRTPGTHDMATVAAIRRGCMHRRFGVTSRITTTTQNFIVIDRQSRRETKCSVARAAFIGGVDVP